MERDPVDEALNKYYEEQEQQEEMSSCCGAPYDEDEDKGIYICADCREECDIITRCEYNLEKQMEYAEMKHDEMRDDAMLKQFEREEKEKE